MGAPLPQGTTVTIPRPDDMHVHFRDGAMLHSVARHTASQFARAIVMPNLKPPVRNLADAKEYMGRIKGALPAHLAHSFTPLMTLYLTDNTTPEEIEAAHASGLVKACKLYPAGATTNSALGVTSLEAITDALRAMEEVGMVLCVHGEIASSEVDMFDREAEFIANKLPVLLGEYPRLKIVLEHITTSEAVNAVFAAPASRLVATMTAHHLLYSRQALFAGAKLHPHMFCLPVLKRESHRRALLEAIGRDEEGRFFAGTDSAPHTVGAKECAEGCAGVFTGCNALELYAEALDEAGLMERFEGFVSGNGAAFYGLERNSGTTRLVKQAKRVVERIEVEGQEAVVPLRAGGLVSWSVEEECRAGEES